MSRPDGTGKGILRLHEKTPSMPAVQRTELSEDMVRPPDSSSSRRREAAPSAARDHSHVECRVVPAPLLGIDAYICRNVTPDRDAVADLASSTHSPQNTCSGPSAMQRRAMKKAKHSPGRSIYQNSHRASAVRSSFGGHKSILTDQAAREAP